MGIVFKDHLSKVGLGAPGPAGVRCRVPSKPEKPCPLGFWAFVSDCHLVFFYSSCLLAPLGCLLAQHLVCDVCLPFPEVPRLAFWTSCLCWVDP